MGHHPAVSIARHGTNLRGLTEAQGREGLATPDAKGLSLLRRIHLSNPDGACFAFASNLQRVAVSYPDDKAQQQSVKHCHFNT